MFDSAKNAEREIAVLGVFEVDDPRHDRERRASFERDLCGQLRGVVAPDEREYEHYRQRIERPLHHSCAASDGARAFPVARFDRRGAERRRLNQQPPCLRSGARALHLTSPSTRYSCTIYNPTP